ncbi:MAG TPA: hypothetical protein VI197_17180 [Polyangiaceae bacterium]
MCATNARFDVLLGPLGYFDDRNDPARIDIVSSFFQSGVKLGALIVI